MANFKLEFTQKSSNCSVDKHSKSLFFSFKYVLNAQTARYVALFMFRVSLLSVFGNLCPITVRNVYFEIIFMMFSAAMAFHNIGCVVKELLYVDG